MSDETEWKALSLPAKLEVIRQGYLDNKTATQIGAPYGLTKSQVLGVAWRNHLTPANAYRWRYGAKRSHPYLRTRKPKPRVPMAGRRARLPNKGKDALSVEAVAIINGLPHFDYEIADVIGNDAATIRHWRRGRQRVTPFMLQCVRDAATRLRA